jgi:small subunit ribosomal protein S17
MTEETRGASRTLQGIVIANAMDKTVRVQMTRRFRHPMYKKIVTRKKVLMAHDEQNECNVGDTVLIVEGRPLSRNKRWRVREILQRAI